MKKTIAKILVITLALILAATAFTGCKKKGKTLDELKQSGKLVIATSPDFPPFEELQSDGSITGIEIDLLNKICEELGVKLVISSMSFESVLPAVQTGKADAGVSGITITESRKKNTLFTDPYCLAAQAIVVTEGSDIKSKADLNGKKVSVQTATTAEKFCMQNGYSVSAYEANSDAEEALLTGKVDAWVIDDLTAAEMVAVHNAGEGTKLVILSEPMTTEPYALAFNFGSEDLVAEINKIIKAMLADGSMKALFEKYDAPFTSP